MSVSQYELINEEDTRKRKREKIRFRGRNLNSLLWVFAWQRLVAVWRRLTLPPLPAVLLSWALHSCSQNETEGAELAGDERENQNRRNWWEIKRREGKRKEEKGRDERENQNSGNRWEIKRREGKRKEGKGREEKGREGKGREGKRTEEKGSE